MRQSGTSLAVQSQAKIALHAEQQCGSASTTT
jgi:hypothetical protein